MGSGMPIADCIAATGDPRKKHPWRLAIRPLGVAAPCHETQKPNGRLETCFLGIKFHNS